MELVLIRGLPGSGKSTTAKRDYPDHRHYEADMFFVNDDGVYVFNPSNVRTAHEWCQRTVERFLSFGDDVVVSNTFTQHWEMAPYLAIAEKVGATVKVVVCDGDYDNVHGVPPHTLEAMRARWED